MNISNVDIIVKDFTNFTHTNITDKIPIEVVDRVISTWSIELPWYIKILIIVTWILLLILVVKGICNE